MLPLFTAPHRDNACLHFYWIRVNHGISRFISVCWAVWMLSFQGQLLGFIFMIPYVTLFVLDQWSLFTWLEFYQFNQSISCVNLGHCWTMCIEIWVELNSLDSKMWGPWKPRGCTRYFQWTLYCFCFILFQNMVCTPWLPLRSENCILVLMGVWWVCSENKMALGSPLLMILGTRALLLMWDTNVLILIQWKYLSAEEACRWCFSECQGQGVQPGSTKDDGCTLCTDEGATLEDGTSTAGKFFPLESFQPASTCSAAAEARQRVWWP